MGQDPAYVFGRDRGSIYVIGRTRSGKSIFLENIAKQDIDAHAGVSFVDPHCDSYNALLDYIPKRRAEDVVIFDPYGERERPVAISLGQAEPAPKAYLDRYRPTSRVHIGPRAQR